MVVRETFVFLKFVKLKRENIRLWCFQLAVAMVIDCLTVKRLKQMIGNRKVTVLVGCHF